MNLVFLMHVMFCLSYFLSKELSFSNVCNLRLCFISVTLSPKFSLDESIAKIISTKFGLKTNCEKKFRIFLITFILFWVTHMTNLSSFQYTGKIITPHQCHSSLWHLFGKWLNIFVVWCKFRVFFLAFPSHYFDDPDDAFSSLTINGLVMLEISLS